MLLHSMRPPGPACPSAYADRGRREERAGALALRESSSCGPATSGGSRPTVEVPGPQALPAAPSLGSRGQGPNAFPHSVGLSLLNCLKKKKSCSERTLPDNTEGIFPRDRPKADSHLKTCPKWSCPSEQIPQACKTSLPTASRRRGLPARPPGPASDWTSFAPLSRAQPIGAPLSRVASLAAPGSAREARAGSCHCLFPVPGAGVQRVGGSGCLFRQVRPGREVKRKG